MFVRTMFLSKLAIVFVNLKLKYARFLPSFLENHFTIFAFSIMVEDKSGSNMISFENPSSKTVYLKPVKPVTKTGNFEDACKPK